MWVTAPHFGLSGGHSFFFFWVGWACFFDCDLKCFSFPSNTPHSPLLILKLASPIPIPRFSAAASMAASEGSAVAPMTTSTSSPLRSTSAMTPHIRIVPHLESTRSLVFGVIERDVPDNTLLKIGRFTDKIFLPNRITFKSKVVSRGHAEIWTEQGKVSKK